jgi:hypothetical protein
LTELFLRIRQAAGFEIKIIRDEDFFEIGANSNE